VATICAKIDSLRIKFHGDTMSVESKMEQLRLDITLAELPLHCIDSCKYVVELDCRIKILYPVIGEPLGLGAVQVITTRLLEIAVVGAAGATGAAAAKTEKGVEKSLYPYEFLD
jgi:hypothetical protein